MAEPRALELPPEGSGQSRVKAEDKPFPSKAANRSSGLTYLGVFPEREAPPHGNAPEGLSAARLRDFHV